MNEAVSLIFLTEVALSGLLFGMIMILWSKIKKQTILPEMKENYLEPVQILVNLEKPCEKILEMCDDFILEAVKDYLFLQGYDKEDYFNATYTKELEEYVTAYVDKFMSKSLRNVIGLYFNTETNDVYKQFIALRIKIVLIEVVSKNNIPLDNN